MPDSANSFRSREIIEGDRLQTLINSLTLDQLRDALSKLSPKKIPIQSRIDASAAFGKTGRSTQETIEVLLEVESDSPFKHCLFVKADGGDFEKIKTEPFPKFSNSSFGFHFVFRRLSQDSVILIFEHNIETTEWVSGEDADTKQKRRFKIRHPVISRINFNTGISTFFYPGFTQGNGTPRKDLIAYESILADLLGQLAEKFNTKFIPIPVQQCIKYCIDGSNSKVCLVRSEIEQSEGRIGLASTNQKAVENLLSNFLSPYISAAGKAELNSAVSKAISEAPANTVVLYWIKEQVVTRLRFWESGTEILFIWHGVPNSFRVVDDIINLFILAAESLSANPTGSWLEWISRQPSGHIITAAEFITTFQFSVEEGRTNLLRAMGIGLIRPMYRLRTIELLEETPNCWVESPHILKQLFHTADGQEIDGTDPKSIEVAFMRVAAGKAAA